MYWKTSDGVGEVTSIQWIPSPEAVAFHWLAVLHLIPGAQLASDGVVPKDGSQHECHPLDTRLQSFFSCTLREMPKRKGTTSRDECIAAVRPHSVHPVHPAAWRIIDIPVVPSGQNQPWQRTYLMSTVMNHRPHRSISPGRYWPSSDVERTDVEWTNGLHLMPLATACSERTKTGPSSARATI